MKGDALESQCVLFEALCASWGASAHKGSEWIELADAVGAEWTAVPVSVDVAWRRHRLLKALVSYHDPTLGLHLETNALGWNLGKPSGENEASLSNHPPSCALFGHLLPGKLHADVLIRIWDAVILQSPGISSPRSCAYFLAAALLVTAREKLLQTSDGEMLNDILKHAASGDVDAHALLKSLVSIAKMTPGSFTGLLDERELPLTCAEPCVDAKLVRRMSATPGVKSTDSREVDSSSPPEEPPAKQAMKRWRSQKSSRERASLVAKAAEAAASGIGYPHPRQRLKRRLKIAKRAMGLMTRMIVLASAAVRRQ